MLLLVPGLGSGTQSTYIKRLIKELSREFKCVYVQYRA
jgi:predicted alpha/beta-fold hydrolase